MIFDIYDTVIALAGVLMIVFRRRFVEHTARFWNTNFSLGYGKRAMRMLEWFAVIGGLVFIGFGLRRFM
jgi:uncharacterized membrane protein